MNIHLFIENNASFIASDKSGSSLGLCVSSLNPTSRKNEHISQASVLFAMVLLLQLIFLCVFRLKTASQSFFVPPFNDSFTGENGLVRGSEMGLKKISLFSDLTVT